MIMHKVDVDELFQGKQSKYALVVGVSKRARQITQKFEDEGTVTEDKPVLLAIDEIKNTRSTCWSPTMNKPKLSLKWRWRAPRIPLTNALIIVVPEPLRSQCAAGKRVLVPFGSGNTPPSWDHYRND